MPKIKVNDTELPEDVFKCSACCVDCLEDCDCEDTWHYEEEKVDGKV